VRRTELVLLEGFGCKFINMQDEDGFDEQTDEDYYDVMEAAERLFKKSGIRVDGEMHEVCLQGSKVMAASTFYGKGRDEDNPDMVLHSFSIVVDPKVQRRGIAKQMVRGILSACPEEICTLQAWVVNPHMAKLLEKFGFESTDRRWSRNTPFMYLASGNRKRG